LQVKFSAAIQKKGAVDEFLGIGVERTFHGDQRLFDLAVERLVWALLLLSGLRDIDAPDVLRSISLAVNGLKHLFNPSPEVLLRLRHRLPIHTGSRVSRNLT
jgi:hypothetical protein